MQVMRGTSSRPRGWPLEQAKPREKDAKQAKNSAKRRKREVQCEANYVDGEDGEICD